VTTPSTYTTLVDCGALGERELVFHYTYAPPKKSFAVICLGDPGNPPDLGAMHFRKVMLQELDVLPLISDALLRDYAIDIASIELEDSPE
jgi:hypothetical protein